MIKTLKAVEPQNQLSFQKILDGIQNDSLYGFLFVDIETPEHLKAKLADFPPIIKNTDVSRADISPDMEKIAEEHGYLKKPQHYLISSNFGEKILINSAMAKFYLELGLKITRIDEFIQFHSSKCFESLALQIAADRREGDRHTDFQILAMTSKLEGNSLYSASLLHKHSHCDITYRNNTSVKNVINTPHFTYLDVIEENLYIEKCRKNKSKIIF